MYTLCTYHNHHYNSELIQPGQGVTANTYCTLMWCPHTHAHIQIDNHYQIEVHMSINTHNMYYAINYASRAAEWSTTVRCYSPNALAAWLHTLYTCHGWNNLVHVYLMFTPTNWCAHDMLVNLSIIFTGIA